MAIKTKKSSKKSVELVHIDGVEIEESPGSVNIEESAFFFFGPPKIGKTTLVSGWPGVIFLVTSDKEVKKLNVPYILIDTWDKAKKAVDGLLKKKTPYKIIAVDVIDGVYSNCGAHVCKKLNIDHQSEAGFGKGVDMIDTEFRRWFNAIIASQYGVVLVSHTQTADTITPNGPVPKTVCTLPPRARRIILPLVSVIGFVTIDTIKTKNEEGKVRYKDRRVIQFKPTDFAEAGDRDGYLPDVVPLFRDPAKTFQYMKDYYTGKKVRDDQDDE